MSNLARRIDAALAGTPAGPWSWAGHNDHASGPYLANRESGAGRCTVMGFERLGMRSAQPTFRRPGDGFWMDRAVSDGLCVQEVNYRSDVVDIDNPTARLIAKAPELLAEARDKLDELRALLTEARDVVAVDAYITDGWGADATEERDLIARIDAALGEDVS